MEKIRILLTACLLAEQVLAPAASVFAQDAQPNAAAEERVAQETGAKVVPMASAVGAVKGADKGADGYLATIDYNVKNVAQALQ